MAVATTSERPREAGHALPYAAAALVTIAAIISAWPAYLMPSFGYLALLLTVAGTATSIYLRERGVNRRLLNIAIVGIAAAFILAMLQQVSLPAAEGGLFTMAMLMDERDAVALVIQIFITVAMFRSFSLLTDRDLTLTIMPASSTLLLAAVLVRHPVVIVAITVFLLGALYLLAFQHQESWGEQARARRWLAPARRRQLIVWVAARMWLILVPAACAVAVLFTLINVPRALLLRFSRQTDHVLALRLYQLMAPTAILPADSIRPDSGRRLRGNILFRVEATEGALWRASTLDTYNGRAWLNRIRPPAVEGDAGERETRVQPEGAQPGAPAAGDEVRRRPQPLVFEDGRWHVPLADPGLLAGVPSRSLEQVVYLEAPMQGVVIAAYEPESLRGPLLRPRVSSTSTLSIVALRRGAAYSVTSQRKVPPGAGTYRPGVSLTPAETARYLSLPEIPERTRRLALQVAADEQDDRDRALALASYLQTEFAYRERVTPPPRGVDAVDYFLHNMEGGYCDYFASAAAVMARIVGIPSRVVTGYRSGEADPVTEWWVVREKHAHSWVEVFLDGYGWFELDATPVGGDETSIVEHLQQAWNSAMAAIRRAAAAPLVALTGVAGWWWKTALALVGMLAVALVARHLFRERPPPLPRGGDRAALREYVRRSYGRMCAWLAAWGLPKAPGATAGEYSLSLAHALGPQAAPMREVIVAYLQAEYAGRALERDDARRVFEHMAAVLHMRKDLLRRD